MIFGETAIAGLLCVEAEAQRDPRGWFARSYCRDEFRARGLTAEFVQANLSWNERAGTLRGLHYSLPPALETKLVRCTRGALQAVVIDLRHASPTFLSVVALPLEALRPVQLYVPAGCAFGFQTLVDATEVSYMMGAIYRPEAERGIRWDDPRFQINWPLPPAVISERDRQFSDFDPARSEW